MKRHLAFVFAAVAAACPGCSEGLKQEHQALVIRSEPGSEAVTCLVVYQGLYVAGGTSPSEWARALAQAKTELAGFLASGRKFGTFLFGQITTVELGPVAEDDPTTAARRKVFSDLIEVANLGFFLDPKEGLCLKQEIRVPRPALLIDACNAMLSSAIDAEMARQLAAPDEKGQPFALTRTARQSLLAAAKASHPWIRVGPGRVSINFPVTPEDAASFLKQMETSPGADERAILPALQAAIEGFEAKAGPDGLTLSMGDGKRRIIAIRQGAEPGAQPRRDAELIEYARTLKLPFDPRSDVEAVIQAFSAK